MQGGDLNDRDGELGERDPEFDLRSVFTFLRRRRLAILIVSLPLLVPATLYPFFLSRYYEATATVTIGKHAPVLEFGRDVLQDVRDNRQAAMVEDSIVTLVTSDAVLGAVLDQMPEGGPTKRSLQEAAKIRLGLSEGNVPSAAQDRQLRLEILRRTLRVRLGGGGDYVLITGAGPSAASAAFVANAIAKAYVSHLAEQREAASQRAVTWLNQQIYELRDQTSRKEQATTDMIAQGLNPRSFDNDDDDATSPLALLETQIQTARIELSAASQRLAELSPRNAARAEDPNEDSARVRQQEQYEKESASLEAARLKFTPTHPEVRRLEEIVASLGARLDAGGAAGRARPSAAELVEYERVSRDKGALESRLRVLEKSRDEQLASGQKSDAYSRYRRLEGELAIDRQMLEVLLTRRNETMLASARKETGAQVLDPAVPPLSPAGPARKKFLVFGWAAAIVAGFAVAFLLEMLDRRLRDPEKISQLLGMPTLCVLPTLEVKGTVPERQGGLGPGSLGAEGYRSLRTALVFAMRTRKIHTLLVGSAVAGEGKTTTSANLAAVFARMGKRVVLVDADMRRPRAHRVFDLPRAPGLSDVLTRTARAADAIVRPKNETFDVLPAGAAPENPTELLGSVEWTELMADLKQDYDLVILDSPVLLAVPDALLLAADADGLVLVHKPGSLERRGLSRLRSDLKSAGARVLGIVFNQIDARNADLYPSYLASPYVTKGSRKRSSWISR